MENHFVILIDGKPYESAADLYTAKHLFNTVDSTINSEYEGSTKTLAYVGNRDTVSLSVSDRAQKDLPIWTSPRKFVVLDA